ncbi:MAG: hypothetical protein ACE5HA_08795, partial [Anaerolineae bacterium]
MILPTDPVIAGACLKAALGPCGSLLAEEGLWVELVAQLGWCHGDAVADVAEAIVRSATPIEGSPNPQRAEFSVRGDGGQVEFVTPAAVEVCVSTTHLVVEFGRESLFLASQILAALMPWMWEQALPLLGLLAEEYSA